MARVQALVVRGDTVLMVLHRQHAQQWWCLPGGAQEPGETPEQGVLRELQEECRVAGMVIRRTSHVCYGPDDETYSFLVDIGDQNPGLGCDPDVPPGQEILADVRWLRVIEIPERDRAFLWAAGLIGVGDFLSVIADRGDDRR